jgi:hypothetical protein
LAFVNATSPGKRLSVLVALVTILGTLSGSVAREHCALLTVASDHDAAHSEHSQPDPSQQDPVTPCPIAAIGMNCSSSGAPPVMLTEAFAPRIAEPLPSVGNDVIPHPLHATAIFHPPRA